MKKSYVSPSFDVIAAVSAPLCASIPGNGSETGDGGWSKGWSGGGFDESESSAEKSNDLFD